MRTVAYGEYAMKKSSALEWHGLFKEGREGVQDDPRSGQPKSKGQMQTNGESTMLFGSNVIIHYYFQATGV
jgi:hypothetical protein